MYFKNIFCIETQELCRTEIVDMTTDIAHLDEGYWEVERLDDDNFLRIKPLFNCLYLKSNYPYDKVLEDNRVIICKNRMDTIISAYGEEQ